MADTYNSSDNSPDRPSSGGFNDPLPEGGHQIIHVPNTLRAKVGPGDKLDPASIKAAEAAIQEMAGDFREWAMKDAQRLIGMVRESNQHADDLAAHFARLYDISHDLKGQGSTFGFDLLTSIAANLCRYLDHSEEPDLEALPIIAAHADALYAVLRFEVKGKDDPIGREIVQELEKLIAR